VTHDILKKYSQSETEMKEKVYTNCMNMFKDISNLEKADTTVPTRDVEANPNDLTLGDLQKQLLNGSSRSNGGTDRNLTEEESDAIERFKQKDKEMDDMIGQINDGLYSLKDKSDQMGSNIDRQSMAMENLDNEIQKTSDQLESSNNRLKNVLENYRSPSKFCMDVVLILMLLGLVAVIMNLAKT